MKSYSDLLDFDVLLQVKKAAPKVTKVPGEVAKACVEALGLYMRKNSSHEDLAGQKYWDASLTELEQVSGLNAEHKLVGTALRSMGLIFWREMDGFHAAWSEEQFKILKKALKA